uniref:Transposase n=1 Tax=Panagrellus redivivus TaxID=6233 RepID=A0A7E4ULB4_PANRE
MPMVIVITSARIKAPAAINRQRLSRKTGVMTRVEGNDRIRYRSNKCIYQVVALLMAFYTPVIGFFKFGH